MITPSNKMRWVPLDGLRGIIACCVFMTHVNYDRFPGTILLMDTFFMLSSFLITRLLLKDWRASGRLDLRTFYERRLRRLYPALVIVVVSTTAVSYFYLHQGVGQMLHVAGALLHFGNWLRALGIPHEYYLGHTWSLAIEEQYYLTWPLLLWGVLKLRWKPSTLVIGLVLIAVFSALWRAYLTLHGAPIERTYNGTDVRLDSLALGAILAISYRSEYVRLWSLRFAKPWVLWPLLALIGWGLLNVNFRTPQWYVWQQPAYALLSLILLMALLQNPKQWGLSTFFQNAPLLYLGKISYGFYLWHYPVLVFAQTLLGLSEWQQIVLCGPITVLLASASYYWVERPILRAGTRTN